MAITVQLDALGSELATGYLSNRQDYAVRHCMVRGLANTENYAGWPIHGNVDLTAARNAVKDRVGDNHHQVKDLPLYQIKAKKWGSTCALVTCTYRRTWQHWGGAHGSEARGHFDGRYISTPVYLLPIDDQAEPQPAWSHGLPAGRWYKLVDETDRTVRPVTYQWSRPVQKAIIPYSMWQSPISAYEQLQATINDVPVTLGTMQFQVGTLRYDFAKEIQVPVGSQMRHTGFYQFTATPDGWVQQFPSFDWQPSSGVSRWVIHEAPAYQVGEWPTTFPTH